MSSNQNDDDVSMASKGIKTEGAKTVGVDLREATRKRAVAAATLRKKDRMELMTKRRMENDSDDDNDNNNNNGGEPAGRGAHRYHEQSLDPRELRDRIAEFVSMLQTDVAQCAQVAANMSEEERQGVSPEGAARAAEALAVQRIRDGLKYTKQLLRLEAPNPFPAFREAGGIAPLMRLTGCPDFDMAADATWCLTSIATGTAAEVECCISHGLVPRMVELLVHPSERVRHQAAWCLGNVCGDGAAHRDLVLEAGGMRAALALIRGRRTPDGPDGDFSNEKVRTLRNGVWLVAQLCRFKPAPPLPEVAIALPTIEHLLATCPDEEVLDDCIWAVSFISDGSAQRIRTVLDAGTVMNSIITTFQKTTGYFESGSMELPQGARTSAVLPCLRIFGNMTAKEETTHLVVDMGIIEHVHPYLQREMVREIRKEACWLLSNCLAGTPEQAQRVLGAKLVPLLVQNIDVPEFEVKKEATWAAANLALYAPADVIRYMVESCSILEPLVRTLATPEERSNQLALEALEPIFRAGAAFAQDNNGVNPYCDRFVQLGGLERLQDLVAHVSNVISMDAAELLRRYFDCGDGDDVDAHEGHWDCGGGDGNGNGNGWSNNGQEQQQQQQPDGFGGHNRGNF